LFTLFQDGWTPLHLAVQTQKPNLVRLLLLRGADKTLRNKVLFPIHNLEIEIILDFPVNQGSISKIIIDLLVVEEKIS